MKHELNTYETYLNNGCNIKIINNKNKNKSVFK